MIGDYENAIKYYKQGIEINRTFYSAYYGLGIVYQLKEDYDTAIEILKKAIEIEPDVTDAYNSLALTFKKKGEIDRALNVYNVAIEKHINNCTQKLKELGIPPTLPTADKKGAIINNEYFEKMPTLLKKDLVYSTLQNGIGCCYAVIGNVELAKKAFRESIQFIPDDITYEPPYYGLKQLEE